MNRWSRNCQLWRSRRFPAHVHTSRTFGLDLLAESKGPGARGSRWSGRRWSNRRPATFDHDTTITAAFRRTTTAPSDDYGAQDQVSSPSALLPVRGREWCVSVVPLVHGSELNALIRRWRGSPEQLPNSWSRHRAACPPVRPSASTTRSCVVSGPVRRSRRWSWAVQTILTSLLSHSHSRR